MQYSIEISINFGEILLEVDRLCRFGHLLKFAVIEDSTAYPQHGPYLVEDGFEWFALIGDIAEFAGLLEERGMISKPRLRWFRLLEIVVG